MKTFLQFIALSCILGILLLPTHAHTQLPFGGQITLYDPVCVTPPGVWLIVGPPAPMNLFYLPGTLSYPFGPPSHSGQYLLGIAGAGFIPCIIWVPCGFTVCPIIKGGGAPILFHGSSV